MFHVKRRSVAVQAGMLRDGLRARRLRSFGPVVSRETFGGLAGASVRTRLVGFV